jgi:ferredoxin-NADP reductase
MTDPRDVEVRLLYSSRSLEEVVYREELARLDADDRLGVHLTLTREWPVGWQGYRRRVDRELLEELAWPPAQGPLVYVCGPTSFVETVADALVQAGHEPAQIRTERFGPSGP